jgi:hypothetical protein
MTSPLMSISVTDIDRIGGWAPGPSVSVPAGGVTPASVVRGAMTVSWKW